MSGKSFIEKKDFFALLQRVVRTVRSCPGILRTPEDYEFGVLLKKPHA